MNKETREEVRDFIIDCIKCLITILGYLGLWIIFGFITVNYNLPVVIVAIIATLLLGGGPVMMAINENK